MIQFNPYNWYWQVDGSTTQVYSSKIGDYVQVADVDYQAWLASGGAVTPVGSEAALGEVLAPYSLRPVAAGVLDAYKDSQASKLTIETVAKVCFNHENRLRALEGQSAVNANQFKTALKALM